MAAIQYRGDQASKSCVGISNFYGRGSEPFSRHVTKSKPMLFANYDLCMVQARNSSENFTIFMPNLVQMPEKPSKKRKILTVVFTSSIF